MLIKKARNQRYVAVYTANVAMGYAFTGYLLAGTSPADSIFLVEPLEDYIDETDTDNLLLFPIIPEKDLHRYLNISRPIDKSINPGNLKDDQVVVYRCVLSEDGEIKSVYADIYKDGLVKLVSSSIGEAIGLHGRTREEVFMTSVPMPHTVELLKDSEVMKISASSMFQHCSKMYDITFGYGEIKDTDDGWTFLGDFESEVLGADMYTVSTLQDTKVRPSIDGERRVTGTYTDDFVRFEDVVYIKVVSLQEDALAPVRVVDYTFKRNTFKQYSNLHMVWIDSNILLAKQEGDVIGMWIRETNKTYLWEWFELYSATNGF